MQTVRINNPIQSHYSQVPNSLWQLECSCTAKAILAFLLSVRDQSTVRVALIEKTLKIGRDKRRAAMRELEGLGLIGLVVCPDAQGRIVTREMWVDTTPLLRASLGHDLPPENPSVGHLPPEKPTVGKTRTTGAENPHNRGGKPVPLNKTNTKTGPAARFKLEIEELTNLERSLILKGHSCVVAGKLLKRSTPEHSAIVDMLRKAVA